MARIIKCFLSCSFREDDADVVNWFRSFLASFPDVEIVEARDAPLPPTQQAEECLKKSDFVCAIVTRREDKGVPSWILVEIGMAKNLNKIIIAFVENEIPKDWLGILPNITEFKIFQRETLGRKAPEYLRYIYNARIEVLKKKRLDRETMRRDRETMSKEIELLKRKIDKLSFDVDVLNEQRNRLDE